jgi:hypothetical protein
MKWKRGMQMAVGLILGLLFWQRELVIRSLGPLRWESDHYFPTLGQPADFEEVAWQRAREFGGLPMSCRKVHLALRASEATEFPIGEIWNGVRENLPFDWGSRTPACHGCNRLAADWLFRQANDPVVAEAVVQHWPAASPVARNRWLDGLLSKRRPCRLLAPTYRPWLTQLCSSAEPNEAIAGATLLLAYADLQPAEIQALVHVLESDALRQVPNAEPGQPLMQALARRGSVPREVVAALQASRSEGSPWSALLAGLVLAQLDPERQPPAELLHPAWSKLSRSADTEVLKLLELPEFRRVAIHPWTLRELEFRLTSKTNTTRSRWGDDSPRIATLRLLKRLGPAARPLLPAVVGKLSNERGEEAQAAAAAFSALAGTNASLVVQAAPQLTNRMAAAGLLLWLTSLGPEASPAEAWVRAVAEDEVRYLQSAQTPLPPIQMDPALMRRYGLTPQQPVPPSESKPCPVPVPQWIKPSSVVVSASAHCPEALLPWWPGYPRGGWTGPGGRRPTVPKANLAELAQRCLVSMRGTPSAGPGSAGQ